MIFSVNFSIIRLRGCDMEDLIKMKNRETGDIVFRIKGMPSRFIEGQEFIPVRRWENDKITSYILKNSLQLAY